MTEILPWLLAIAAQLSGLPAANLPPVIALPSPSFIRAVCPDRPDECHGIVAYYHAEANVVLYDDHLKPDTDMTDASFLVHEFVHALQNQARGEPITCQQVLEDEREAYDVQNRFLARTGQLYLAGRVMWFATCSDGARPDAA